jgi:hypothetical protein
MGIPPGKLHENPADANKGEQAVSGSASFQGHIRPDEISAPRWRSSAFCGGAEYRALVRLQQFDPVGNIAGVLRMSVGCRVRRRTLMPAQRVSIGKVRGAIEGRS